MKLKETDIARACTDFLALDGWRPIKMEPVSNRAWGKGTGEKGQPDYLYIRYGAGASAEVLWIEWKAPRGKVAPHQRDWHTLERKRGATVWVATEQFEPNIDAFMGFYRRSGMARRRPKLQG